MTSVNETLSERGKRYGEFDEHARIAQDLKYECTQSINWSTLAPDQREAIDMICHKLARILNGDADYADSWHDIAGYATLVENRLNKKTL